MLFHCYVIGKLYISFTLAPVTTPALVAQTTEILLKIKTSSLDWIVAIEATLTQNQCFSVLYQLTLKYLGKSLNVYYIGTFLSLICACKCKNIKYMIPISEEQ